jgi:hypothetical protein
MKRKPRKFYYHNHDGMGLMVIAEKMRGAGMVKSYGAGHTTELDLALRFEARVSAAHPDDCLYLSIYSHVSYDRHPRYTMSDDKLPVVLKTLSDYWKATGVRVSYNELFTLMGVK